MQLEPMTIISGPAPYLRRANVDTDVIIRIEWLTDPGKEHLGLHAMEALRYREDGSEDPECVLNWPVFHRAPILIAGENFGCGSSREAAVWALQGIGVRCVIAPDFGDIFFSNCFQNGVLPIRLPVADVEMIGLMCEQGNPLTVDLIQQVLLLPDDRHVPFTVDPLRRDGLLNGLDDIGLTLQHSEGILQWQQADRLRRPWVWHGLVRDQSHHGSTPRALGE